MTCEQFKLLHGKDPRGCTVAELGAAITHCKACASCRFKVYARGVRAEAGLPFTEVLAAHLDSIELARRVMADPEAR